MNLKLLLIGAVVVLCGCEKDKIEYTEKSSNIVQDAHFPEQPPLTDRLNNLAVGWHEMHVKALEEINELQRLNVDKLIQLELVRSYLSSNRVTITFFTNKVHNYYMTGLVAEKIKDGKTNYDHLLFTEDGGLLPILIRDSELQTNPSPHVDPFGFY